MSYEHKHELTTRDTKQILTNILPAGKEEYELEIRPSTIKVPKNQDESESEEANVLPEEADALITEMDNTSVPSEASLESEEGNVDQYEDENEFDFDPEEPKRAFEKKKKGRDYMEFRNQYYRY
ncbi:MAG: hypothetical protein KGY80_08000 [Candidatus Thorarchaeota archaeon]|nr:hypothetical protein [Candidatus Thorarchaeota archaeon]